MGRAKLAPTISANLSVKTNQVSSQRSLPSLKPRRQAAREVQEDIEILSYINSSFLYIIFFHQCFLCRAIHRLLPLQRSIRESTLQYELQVQLRFIIYLRVLHICHIPFQDELPNRSAFPLIRGVYSFP